MANKVKQGKAVPRRHQKEQRTTSFYPGSSFMSISPHLQLLSEAHRRSILQPVVSLRFAACWGNQPIKDPCSCKVCKQLHAAEV
eukprot:6385726-Amphidinium_carterae.2